MTPERSSARVGFGGVVLDVPSVVVAGSFGPPAVSAGPGDNFGIIWGDPDELYFRQFSPT